MSKAYVVKSFGQPILGQVEVIVGLQTQYGVVAETNVGMQAGVCHIVSGTRGVMDSTQYADKLFVESGSLISQTWPTGVECFPFGMSNFTDPNRPSGVYIYNGTNSVPAASYR